MKKALVAVFRLSVLVAALAFFLFTNKDPHAQSGGNTCQTFDTVLLDCPSCCSNPTTTFPNMIVTSSGPGTQSIQDTNYSCGTAAAGCATACTGTYPQAVSDSSCCKAQGSACAAAEPCCPGTTCQGGVCRASGFCGPSGCGCFWPCTTPIIIDIHGGFALTSAENGVLFDMGANGHPIQIAWTASGVANGFLALPGADGLIHDGSQLFGNITAQPPSDDPNGFRALAVYDDPKNGGNGDGIIDAHDRIWTSLRVWVDANHDGLSQSEELYTLPALGIDGVGLDYRIDHRTDQNGNVFRYRGTVRGRVDHKIYDVILVNQFGSLARP